MRWMVLLAVVPAFAALPVVAPLGAEAGVSELSAEQVAEKNVAARGGAEAWNKIQTMVWIGHMESVRAPVPSMTFVMELKRPNKTRFEINAMGQKTVRVFDGTHGWKVQPNREAGPDAKPYTPQEVTFAFRAQLIDGPLIDYQAKGNVATLEGLDEVEGRKAFRLKVQLASGETDHVWIDAQTFLDIKYERPSYGPPGTPSTVSVFYKDYKLIEGLQIPGVIETASAPGQTPDRMVIERVALNPPLEDRIFTRPGAHARRNGIASDAPSERSVGRIPGFPSGSRGASRSAAAPGPQTSPPADAAPAAQSPAPAQAASPLQPAPTPDSESGTK
jgi:outer membrane lipoprotein-sorting protein